MESPIRLLRIAVGGALPSPGGRGGKNGAVDATLLLVEDDPSVREVTQVGLQRAGFTVLTARDGNEGLSLFRSRRPDAVILDVMLPGRDGLEVCRAIRQESAVPVVMLTALSGTIDVVVGLEAGADDYVTKPFEMAELVARVRAALRRATQMSPAEVVALGPLRIDPAAHTVESPDGEIPLTPTEFRLLVEMARRPGQVFTREMLLERVWGYGYLGDSRLVDVAVQRLRAKVEPDPAQPALIRTVRGVGYRAAPR
jgi:two-component system response regulator MtrA